MKKLFVLLGVAALLATVTAQAQTSGYPLVPIPITLPSVIPAANDPTNFATPVVLDLKKVDVTTIYFTLSSPTATTNRLVTFTGAWSGDGVTYDTNNTVTLTALAGGVTPTATCTNILTRNGRRYFEILSESGQAGTIITNNSAGYSMFSTPW
jgi:hypothetical protein